MTTFYLLPSMLEKLSAGDLKTFRNMLISQEILKVSTSNLFPPFSALFPEELYLNLGQALQNTKVTTLLLQGIEMNSFSITLAQALRGTQVHTLVLFNNAIGKHALAMVQALQDTQVHTLCLGKNGIGRYAPAMAKALQNTQVHTLTLSYNSICKYAPALAKALQNTQVHTLNLGNNNISQHAPAFVQALCNTQVHTLDLSSNGIGGHAPAMAQALQGTKIKILDFKYNLDCDPKLLAPIAKALTNTSICVFKGVNAPEIELVILENRRRIYTQSLKIAEYQGALLKKLYQEAFPWNAVSFPPSIAYRIMKFLGYSNDENLHKRFLNKLKLHSSTVLADPLSNPTRSIVQEENLTIIEKFKKSIYDTFF